VSGGSGGYILIDQVLPQNQSIWNKPSSCVNPSNLNVNGGQAANNGGGGSGGRIVVSTNCNHRIKQVNLDGG